MGKLLVNVFGKYLVSIWYLGGQYLNVDEASLNSILQYHIIQTALASYLHRTPPKGSCFISFTLMYLTFFTVAEINSETVQVARPPVRQLIYY